MYILNYLFITLFDSCEIIKSLLLLSTECFKWFYYHSLSGKVFTDKEKQTELVQTLSR